MQYPTNSFAWIPMGVIYVVIPVGLGLVLIERTLLLVGRLRRAADDATAIPATRPDDSGGASQDFSEDDSP